MTLHTPVVFTDDQAVSADARARHWPVVSVVGDRLQLTGVTQTAPLPEARMDIAGGSLSQQDTAGGWKFVLDWVAKHVHKPLLVTTAGSPMVDLARWASTSRGWPHRVVAVLDELPDSPLLEEVRPLAPSPSERTPGTTRVLLVAHRAGTERVDTWLASRSDSVQVDLVTTAPRDVAARVHVVPDRGIAGIAPGTGSLDAVSALVLDRARQQAYDPVLAEAGTWQLALERHFEGRDDHYDVVVLTGPPVAHFGFAAWAQRVWYARTVLDLGPSPESQEVSDEEAAVRSYWERGWAMAADVVTAPTSALAEDVVRSGPEARIEVVRDGAAEAAGALLTELGDHSYQP